MAALYWLAGDVDQILSYCLKTLITAKVADYATHTDLKLCANAFRYFNLFGITSRLWDKFKELKSPYSLQNCYGLLVDNFLVLSKRVSGNLLITSL